MTLSSERIVSRTWIPPRWRSRGVLPCPCSLSIWVKKATTRPRIIAARTNKGRRSATSCDTGLDLGGQVICSFHAPPSRASCATTQKPCGHDRSFRCTWSHRQATCMQSDSSSRVSMEHSASLVSTTKSTNLLRSRPTARPGSGARAASSDAGRHRAPSSVSTCERTPKDCALASFDDIDIAASDARPLNAGATERRTPVGAMLRLLH